jgi:hypothetical protein
MGTRAAPHDCAPNIVHLETAERHSCVVQVVAGPCDLRSLVGVFACRASSGKERSFRDPAVLRLLPIPLQATGAVRCWGGNLKGELGLGDTITRGDSKFPGHGDRPSILSGYGACQRVIDLDCGGSMRAL